MYPSFSTQINILMVFLQKQLNIVGLNIQSRDIAAFLLEKTKLLFLNLNSQARVLPLYQSQSDFFVLEINDKQNYESKEDAQNEKKKFLNYSSCNSCRYVLLFRGAISNEYYENMFSISFRLFWFYKLHQKIQMSKNDTLIKSGKIREKTFQVAALNNIQRYKRLKTD